MLFRSILVFLIVLLPPFCRAEEQKVQGEVLRVSDQGFLYFESGETAELAGIIIDKEYQKDAVAFIKKQTEGQMVELVYADKQKNRHGNLVTFVYDKNGKLLQDSLLKRGLVIAYSSVASNTLNYNLIQAEGVALNNKAGVWRKDIVISAAEAESHSAKYHNKFMLVEGVLVGAKLVRDKLYLNFGPDWKTDFTVIIRKENLKNFKEFDFATMTGEKIRVRGWIDLYNGPAMEIYNSGHIELL